MTECARRLKALARLTSAVCEAFCTDENFTQRAEFQKVEARTSAHKPRDLARWPCVQQPSLLLRCHRQEKQS